MTSILSRYHDHSEKESRNAGRLSGEEVTLSARVVAGGCNDGKEHHGKDERCLGVIPACPMLSEMTAELGLYGGAARCLL